MGQQTSSIARKVSRSVSSLFGVTSNNETTSISTAHLAVTPFVFKRQGSMYFDEDGDLAHAFYIEKNSNGCAKMVQTWDNLYPQEFYETLQEALIKWIEIQSQDFLLSSTDARVIKSSYSGPSSQDKWRSRSTPPSTERRLSYHIMRGSPILMSLYMLASNHSIPPCGGLQLLRKLVRNFTKNYLYL